VTRLLPFGERCFEAAVYIMGRVDVQCASLSSFAFRRLVRDKIRQVIRRFFRHGVVAIELLYSFSNEAFGMYDEDRPVDQKGLTLCRFLASRSASNALYSGSGLFNCCEPSRWDTTPIPVPGRASSGWAAASAPRAW